MPNPSQALPADELTPIYFAVYHDKTLKIGTMKTYLAGVWNLHILNGFDLPLKQFMHLGRRLTRQCFTSELIRTYNSPWSSGPQFFPLCRAFFPGWSCNFWNAFFFEYNMRKSVGPKSAISLRHVTNCSRIHTTTAAQVFFRLFPSITQTLSCFHCLQASM